MTTAIVQALGSLISWASAAGVDKILGKWVAYFTIAWNEASTFTARKSFDENMAAMKASMVANAPQWDAWRKKVSGDKKS